MNSFVSTTMERPKALQFIQKNFEMSDDMEPVLFEIDADPRKVSFKPFADISTFSEYSSEKEVLFMLGSIFRLNQISQDIDGQISTIQMTLCSDDEHELKGLYDYMKNLYGNGETNLRSLGLVMWRMGKFDQAEKFFRRLLDSLSPKDPLLSALYQNLGLVASDKGEYDASLQWYQKSLNIKLRTRSSDYVNIGISHNSIGMVYYRKGNLFEALQSFTKAATLFEKAKDENHLTMGYVYNGIGTVYQQQKDYSNSLLFYQKSLAIYQMHLPSDHPDLGSSYNSIGAVHYSLGEDDLALEYYDRSLEIYSKSLPPQHPDIAITYENIGNVYKSKDDLKQALSYFQHAATIRHHALSSQHPITVRNDEVIQRLKDKLQKRTIQF
ncbi:unnamed protein product [Rotaria sp. Silwood2]|nr:unnamed protein product [Rotaria sp. Silwood2]CAF3091168.1 unnamed protein product [Rotaria sp. Silwood2]CAF3410496.1 unnamed protein product [Rotaria sp. Silwood2]CAF4180629.1 unnamed protein product [Rotaria sp. Silwood2]CAF4379419.1 unnamed protein product [Rotaria sp. Silwood2]